MTHPPPSSSGSTNAALGILDSLKRKAWGYFSLSLCSDNYKYLPSLFMTLEMKTVKIGKDVKIPMGSALKSLLS